ncbi:hypothetical protein LJB99_03830 [Deltaproteobacteria bacterium OttesenSCG-928-K17]|nr:hypothetical protein [Deltaproteobacteria bacterium OttesenSCG-928-K17]
MSKHIRHRNIYLVLGGLLALLLVVVIFSREAEEPAAVSPPFSGEEARAIAALGHGAFALAKISAFNDRVVLEDELRLIYDNLNPRGISDPKAASLMINLENTLTSYRLNDEAGKKIVQIYDKKMEQGLMNAMGRVGLVSINDANRSGKDLLSKGAGPGTSLSAAALSAMSASNSAFADYQRDMVSYQVYLNENDWRLNPTEAGVIAELGEMFAAAYGAALEQYDSSAKWGGGSSLFQNLIAAGSAPDAATRHRILARTEDDYRFIPVYWFLRAEAAAAAHRERPSIDYSQDLSHCLAEYEKYRGFFKRDEIYAAILMLELSTFIYPSAEVEKKLAQVMEQGTEDPAPRRIFAALLCLQQGLFDKSASFLQANMNDRRLEAVSRTLMAEALGAKGDRPALWRLLDGAMNDKTVTNQEVLHYLGKISDQMVLQRFMPEVDGIKVMADPNLFGPDALVLTLPKRWRLIGQANLNSTLNAGGRLIRTSKAGVAAGGEYVNLLFEDAFRQEELLESGRSLDLYFELATEYFPVHFSGRLAVREKEAEPIQQETDDYYAADRPATTGLWEPGYYDEDAPPPPPRPVIKEIVFTPGEISTVESCWSLDDAYRLTPCRR